MDRCGLQMGAQQDLERQDPSLMEIVLPSVSPPTQASGLQEAWGQHVAAPLSF